MIKSLLVFVLCMTVSTWASQEVVLITGATRGIGLATAKLLAQEGYTVYAGARNIPEQNTDAIHWVQLDVTNQNSVDQAVQDILAKEGKIDVLVNNAGIMIYGSVENVTIAEAQELFDVNFFGVMRVTQAILPSMRTQQQGKIIQISSRSGFRPLPTISIYAASKFALEGLSETMAALLTPWNISVSLIEPGPVSTELDYLSPYGTRLERLADPYFPIFDKSGLLEPGSPITQSAQEIAAIALQVIRSEKPHLRYQTTELIQKQAALRLVDTTGDAGVNEWRNILFR